MLLKSKVGGSAAERSTYFTYDHHVDDENHQWHDDPEDDLVHIIDELAGRVVKIADDTFDGLRCQCAE